jgi:hypothetical protein
LPHKLIAARKAGLEPFSISEAYRILLIFVLVLVSVLAVMIFLSNMSILLHRAKNEKGNKVK